MSYLQFNNEIFKATEYDRTQAFILSFIVQEAHRQHTSAPIIQQTYISKETHYNIKTIKPTLQKLVKGGFISYKPTYFFKGEAKYSSTIFHLTTSTLELIGWKTTNPETKAEGNKSTPSVTTSANKAKPTKQQSEEERLAEQLAKALDEGDKEALVRIGKTITDPKAQQRIKAMVVTIRENKRANEVKQ